MKKKHSFWLLIGALLIIIIVLFLFIYGGKKPSPKMVAASEQGQRKTETSEYPLITHDLVGRDKCMQCHETGKGGAPVAPAEDHVGFTDDLCRECHEPA